MGEAIYFAYLDLNAEQYATFGDKLTVYKDAKDKSIALWIKSHKEKLSLRDSSTLLVYNPMARSWRWVLMTLNNAMFMTCEILSQSPQKNSTLGAYGQTVQLLRSGGVPYSGPEE